MTKKLTGGSGETIRFVILDRIWLLVFGSDALQHLVFLVADVVSFQAALS